MSLRINLFSSWNKNVFNFIKTHFYWKRGCITICNYVETLQCNSTYNVVYKVFTTTLDKTCWGKSWKSSKFKKWLNYSNSKFFPLLHNVNVESSQVFLLKAENFANNIDLGGEGFFHWKIGFLFCLNSFVQDCRLLIFSEKTIPNCSMVLKCMLEYCML